MRVICIGDNVIDYYQNTGEMFPGGNALNTAVHAARLGADSCYLGNIGNDAMSDVIRKCLLDNSVTLDQCRTIDGGTTKHCVYEVINGERRFLEVQPGDHWSGPMELKANEIAYLKTADIMMSSCNAKMEHEMYKLAELDGLYIYDFGEKDKYHVSEYLAKVCDHLDLAMFSLTKRSETEVYAFCRRIAEAGADSVLITMGTAGQYYYHDGKLLFCKAEVTDAVDTMGAGDSYLTAFVIEMYRKGWRKHQEVSEEAVNAAMKAASIYSMKNCLVAGGFGQKV